MKDAILNIITWKCPLLPLLPARVWYGLWALSGVLIVGHAVGQAAGWWPHNADLVLITNIANVLLIFTPMECHMWMARHEGGRAEDYVFVSRRTARRMLASPTARMELAEVITGRKGEVLRMRVYTPKAKTHEQH